MREKGRNSWHKLAPISYKHIPSGWLYILLDPLTNSWRLLNGVSCRQSLLTQLLMLAPPWGTDLGQPSGDSPLGSSCGIPQHSLPNTNTSACALSRSPKMWCLLVLLCSQGIAFSAGFTTPSTLNSDTSQYRKTRNPECFMNVVSWVTFSPFLSKASLHVPLPLPITNSPCQEAKKGPFHISRFPNLPFPKPLH